MVEVTAQEVVEVLQARYPRELEIAVLTVQNAKLQQQAAEQEETLTLGASGNDE